MSTVIVVTNFSASSRNALEYACSFLHNAQTRLLLLNVFSFPSTINNDGIAIAALAETFANDERKLLRELQWVQENYPGINIESEMVTGVFLEELQNKIREEQAVLVIMGTAGNYADLLSWDANIINSFVDLLTPVLIVPSQVRFQPLKKIAFACNYYRKNLQVPVSMLRRLIQFTKAELFVINVVSPQEPITEEGIQNKRILKESLADLSPVYYEPEFNNVITAIDNFVEAEDIDMLLVIPTRHGIWYNIFQRSHTKGLVYLNHLPILSLRQEENFL
jgi:nucleotide-binding universal stress UspA family protein